jgi:hypothetical protein
MTREEVIQRLKKENRAEVARGARLPRKYLDKLVYNEIKNPGSEQMDRLRSYFLSLDIMRGRPQ